jgi:hypothetical protein
METKHLVIAQFFPLEARVGKYATTREDCETFNKSFIDEVNIVDEEHKSIVMFLEDDGSYKTCLDIQIGCIAAMKNIYKDYVKCGDAD